MNDCRIIPCYKLFLNDLKEIMLTKPINFSLTTISYSSDSAEDRSPDIDIEHISIKHHHQFPVGSTVVEAVNRGVQANIRSDTNIRNYYCKSCTTRETAGSCSSILNSKLVNGQVVSRRFRIFVFLKLNPNKKIDVKSIVIHSIYRIIMEMITVSQESVRLAF